MLSPHKIINAFISGCCFVLLLNNTLSSFLELKNLYAFMSTEIAREWVATTLRFLWGAMNIMQGAAQEILGNHPVFVALAILTVVVLWKS